MPWSMRPLAAIIACQAVEAEGRARAKKAAEEQARLDMKLWREIGAESLKTIGSQSGRVVLSRYSCINCGAPYEGESTCSYCKTER